MTPNDANPFVTMRRAMVASQLRTSGVTDARLLEAMAQVPREHFVPEPMRASAYIDRPIELGGGRALNPPLVTALLLEAAAIQSSDRVLIVGAATGYAPTVAAALAARVVAVECDARMAERARESMIGIELVEGPLAVGVPGHGPFDAIVVDGAIEQVPEAIVDQLAPHGRLAAALLDDGVTRLALGRKGGKGFAMVPFIDAEAVLLPGFALPRVFAF
ncbi:MAG: protein-L-isoaspartate O-methyltransferase family protein [Sphingomonadaceae bacterium]